MVASESFTDAFKRAREEKPGFVEGGQRSQGLPPGASVGYQAGNIANQAGAAVSGLKDLVPQNSGPRFHVNTSAVSKIDPNLSGGAFAPENSPSPAGGVGEPILGQEDRRRRASPAHQKVMDRKQGLAMAPALVPASPPADVGPDVTGNTLADFVNTQSGPQENLGVTVGKSLRDVVPAIKTTGKAVAGTFADVATVVPRSFAHVGGNVVAGYKGGPGNNDFNVNPATDRLLAGQPADAQNDLIRPNGTAKGAGFLGSIPAAGGKTMTELTIGVNIGGKEMDIPSIVPTLTQAEIQHLANGGKPTNDIVNKAVAHAKERMNNGQGVYFDNNLTRQDAIGDAATTSPPIQIPKPPDAGTVQPNNQVVLPGQQRKAMPSMPGAAVPLSVANPANDPALYDTNRTTGPIMLTNVGPGNAGGKALGDVAAFKTANALEGSRPPSGPATEIPAGSLRQVGNLDVSFSPETTPEQRQAFMKDPVRPTAQINRYNNANSLAGLTQGQRASMNADKVINGGVGQSLASVTMPAQYSPTGPSATWKQAAAKDSKVIANAAERRDARNAVRTGIKERELDIVEQKAIADTENAAAGRDIQGLSLAASVANNQANQQFNSERLKNDKARTDSLKALNQGKLAQVDTINKLQQEYLSPDTDPKRKSAIATELRTLASKDERKDKGAVPTYVKPEFDKKGVQRPGTGRFVYPPGYIDDLFGDGFNKDDASPEQMSVLLDLAKNDPDLYKTLKSKFN